MDARAVPRRLDGPKAAAGREGIAAVGHLAHRTRMSRHDEVLHRTARIQTDAERQRLCRDRRRRGITVVGVEVDAAIKRMLTIEYGSLDEIADRHKLSAALTELLRRLAR